jgi:hypothetical protein
MLLSYAAHPPAYIKPSQRFIFCRVAGFRQPRHAKMLSSTFLIASLALFTSVYASPVTVRDTFVTIPIAKRVNTTGGALRLVQHDRARVQGLHALASGSHLRPETIVGSLPATNQAVDYVATVCIPIRFFEEDCAETPSVGQNWQSSNEL